MAYLFDDVKFQKHSEFNYLTVMQIVLSLDIFKQIHDRPDSDSYPVLENQRGNSRKLTCCNVLLPSFLPLFFLPLKIMHFPNGFLVGWWKLRSTYATLSLYDHLTNTNAFMVRFILTSVFFGTGALPTPTKSRNPTNCG